MTAPRPLWSGFAASAARAPDRPAVDACGRVTTYGALFDAAASVAATLRRVRGGAASEPFTAVLVERDATGFASVLGALMSGTGYVPLSPSVPAARLAVMLERSGCTTLVADASGDGRLRDVLALSPGVARVVLVGDAGATASLRAGFPAVQFVAPGDLAPASAWSPPPSTLADDAAYLLFTSGSTGTPRGVAVAHRSIRRFLDVVVERWALAPSDRFSQMFDLGFDLSLFDLFAAWECGGTVCVPSAAEMRIPAGFVAGARLTVWFSVPSAAVLMRRLGLLAPRAFPSLRVSLFCGESLTWDAASAWIAAAPASIVENLYGPTEATLACTAHRVDGTAPRDDADGGVVPIGEPLPGMSARVVDESLRDAAPGAAGELLVAGPQVALGYWRDAEATAARFVRPAPGDAVHYRTGDRVRRSEDGALRFLGRTDHQLRVRGHRVELGDVESAVRRASGADVVVALGWPVVAGSAEGLVAFVGADEVDAPRIRAAVASLVPSYMVPARFVAVPAMPLNANGKVDRAALARTLEGRADARHP